MVCYLDGSLMRKIGLASIVVFCTLFPATSFAQTKDPTAKAEELFHSGKREEAIKMLEAVPAAQTYASRRASFMLGEFRIATGHRADAEAPLMQIICRLQQRRHQREGSHQAWRSWVARRPAPEPEGREQRVQRERARRQEARRDAALARRAVPRQVRSRPRGRGEREALAIAPKSAKAMVLMARVKLEQTLDFDAAEKLVNDALAVNPKLAERVRRARGPRLARHGPRRHRQADRRRGSPSTRTTSSSCASSAAERFLADDQPGFEQAKKEVFARNAEYARMFYEIVGEYAEWEHRYDDIVGDDEGGDEARSRRRQGVGELGLTQMRSGDETNGLDALRKAWAKDSFNVRVYNTLNLYEKTIANDYETDADGVVQDPLRQGRRRRSSSATSRSCSARRGAR